MVEFLLASLAIFLVLAGWLLVEHLYRGFAARHPEAGPYRSERGGCAGGCGACGADSCDVGSRR